MAIILNQHSPQIHKPEIKRNFFEQQVAGKSRHLQSFPIENLSSTKSDEIESEEMFEKPISITRNKVHEQELFERPSKKHCLLSLVKI